MNEYTIKDYLQKNFNINKPIKKWVGDFNCALDDFETFTSLKGCP
jgi:hypothetical protein